MVPSVPTAMGATTAPSRTRLGHEHVEHVWREARVVVEEHHEVVSGSVRERVLDTEPRRPSPPLLSDVGDDRDGGELPEGVHAAVARATVDDHDFEVRIRLGLEVGDATERVCEPLEHRHHDEDLGLTQLPHRRQRYRYCRPS